MSEAKVKIYSKEKGSADIYSASLYTDINDIKGLCDKPIPIQYNGVDYFAAGDETSSIDSRKEYSKILVESSGKQYRLISGFKPVQASSFGVTRCGLPMLTEHWCGVWPDPNCTTTPEVSRWGGIDRYADGVNAYYTIVPYEVKILSKNGRVHATTQKAFNALEIINSGLYKDLHHEPFWGFNPIYYKTSTNVDLRSDEHNTFTDDMKLGDYLLDSGVIVHKNDVIWSWIKSYLDDCIVYPLSLSN